MKTLQVASLSVRKPQHIPNLNGVMSPEGGAEGDSHISVVEIEKRLATTCISF